MPRLRNFYERTNELFDCSCMTSWFEYLPEVTYNTSCNVVTTPLNPTSVSIIETTTETTTESEITTTHATSSSSSSSSSQNTYITSPVTEEANTEEYTPISPEQKRSSRIIIITATLLSLIALVSALFISVYIIHYRRRNDKTNRTAHQNPLQPIYMDPNMYELETL